MFRRATHDKITGKYLEKFKDENMSQRMKNVWENHGDIVHMLSSEREMDFDELLQEIRKDTTNYNYEDLPTQERVALSLIKLIEVGFVEASTK